MTPEFRAAALALLIPCDVRAEQRLLDWLAAWLEAHGVAREDQSAWLRSELDRWRDTGSAGPDLRNLFGKAIFDAERQPQSFTLLAENTNLESHKSDACAQLAKRYFLLHGRLQQLMLTSEEARLVLSYAGLVFTFAIDQQMSASEISQLLGGRDRRLALNWHPVAAIMADCKCAAKFEKPQMQSAFAATSQAEPLLLADLSTDEAAAYVGSLSKALGCERDLTASLRHLVSGKRHDPYLMMLHYQLAPLTVCDHAVTFAYEFSPRGLAAQWLVLQYAEAGLAVKGDPYLNNAKALLRFDSSWAWGREDHLGKAHAFVIVLEEVETLSALPKAELARYVCALLMRLVRITREENHGGLPSPLLPLSLADQAKLLPALAAANTSTNGIIEQRLVDAATSARHQGWAVHGRADSVFAASTFRRKLGDVEYIRIGAGQPTLIGYESHGGRLTASYVESHIATFSAVLAKRREEMETAGLLSDWQLETVFVSHAAEAGLRTTADLDIDGQHAILKISYTTFAALANELIGRGNAEWFNDHVIAVLNAHRVPGAVRQRVIDLLP